jgi:hypothetical protein
LSAANPATIWMQGSTFNQITRYTVTANQAFIDDNGASEIITNTFGTTAGASWQQSMPFFLYAVVNGNPGGNGEPPIAFMISRVPHHHIAVAVASIGAPDDPVANTNGSMWSIDNITEADYAGQPCLVIGSFLMRKTAADDWTVQTLSASDGIGQFQEGVAFTPEVLQNGATYRYWSSSNGGDTIPEYNTDGVYYIITKDGLCHFVWNFANINVDGVGTGNIRVHIPLRRLGDATTTSNSGYSHLDVTNNAYLTAQPTAEGSTPAFFEFIINGNASRKLRPEDYTTTGVQITTGSFVVTYNITRT